MQATKQRTTQSKRTLKKTDIGPSKSVLALMIAIDWTSAQVVTITAKKAIKLQALSVSTKTGEVIEQPVVAIPAGRTLHFVRASSGLYYIGQVSPAGVVGCSCPHRVHKGECKHQEAILAAHNAKARRAIEREASEFAVAVLPTDAPEVPATCPTDANRSIIEQRLQGASPEERKAIWKQLAKAEQERKRARSAEYWSGVQKLREQVAVAV